MNSNNPNDKHEQIWYAHQKARVKNAVENATLIWSEGDEALNIPQGYYVFWYARETPYHDLVRVHQYMGKGDAQTQVNIENWITERQRERMLKK